AGAGDAPGGDGAGGVSRSGELRSERQASRYHRDAHPRQVACHRGGSSAARDVRLRRQGAQSQCRPGFVFAGAAGLQGGTGRGAGGAAASGGALLSVSNEYTRPTSAAQGLRGQSNVVASEPMVTVHGVFSRSEYGDGMDSRAVELIGG